MLRAEDISAGYGEARVLGDLTLSVAPGEILCLLGRNGAGKTTFLKCLMGLVRLWSGRVMLGDTELSALPAWQVPRHGIGFIPQGRGLFSELTVAENLEIGLMARSRGEEDRERALAMFPRLRERLQQEARTLSGGEQQMLATARALCLAPKVLLLDEPNEGLQPSMVTLLRDAVLRLRGEGVAIILVEQRVEAVATIADRVAFIESGRLALECAPERLREEPELVHRYVGV